MNEKQQKGSVASQFPSSVNLCSMQNHERGRKHLKALLYSKHFQSLCFHIVYVIIIIIIFCSNLHTASYTNIISLCCLDIFVGIHPYECGTCLGYIPTPNQTTEALFSLACEMSLLDRRV